MRNKLFLLITISVVFTSCLFCQVEGSVIRYSPSSFPGGSPITGARVTIKNADNLSSSSIVTTNALGYNYTLNGEDALEVSCLFPEDMLGPYSWKEGIDAIDLALIINHIDRKAKLDPFGTYAADITSIGGVGIVNNDDKLTIQSVIANACPQVNCNSGPVSSLPVSYWHFLPAEYLLESSLDQRFYQDFWNSSFVNVHGDEYPFLAVYEDSNNQNQLYPYSNAMNSWVKLNYGLTSSDCHETNFDFYAVKKGDLNHDALDPSVSNIATNDPPLNKKLNKKKSSKYCRLNIVDNRKNKRSSKNTIKVSLTTEAPIMVYQVALELNSSSLRDTLLNNFELGEDNFKEEMVSNYYSNDEQKIEDIRFVWAAESTTKTRMFKNYPIYQFDVNEDNEFSLENDVFISERFIESMFIDSNLNHINAEITIEVY